MMASKSKGAGFDLDTREIQHFARLARKYAPDVKKEMDKRSRAIANRYIVRKVRRAAPVGPNRRYSTPSGQRRLRPGGQLRDSVRISGGAFGNKLIVGNKKKSPKSAVTYQWFVEAGTRTRNRLRATHFIRKAISKNFEAYYRAWIKESNKAISEMARDVARGLRSARNIAGR